MYFILLRKGIRYRYKYRVHFFLYIDANPQTYVDNIFKAKEEDFKAQTHKVYNDSSIEFTILK